MVVAVEAKDGTEDAVGGPAQQVAAGGAALPSCAGIPPAHPVAAPPGASAAHRDFAVGNLAPRGTQAQLGVALQEHEKRRQRDSLILIASENLTSKSVYDALGSIM